MASPSIIAACQNKSVKALLYKEGAETGLTDSEKATLEDMLSNKPALMGSYKFYSYLEHALYVADNKYNSDPVYEGIRNCIYDSMET
jgi:hypothetical protein